MIVQVNLFGNMLCYGQKESLIEENQKKAAAQPKRPNAAARMAQ